MVMPDEHDREVTRVNLDGVKIGRDQKKMSLP